MRDLKKLHQEVADILDEAAVRGKVSYDSTARLRQVPGEWQSAGGSAEYQPLLSHAQGIIGMLNSSDDRDPLRNDTRTQLLELKRTWRAVADKLIDRA